MSELDKGYELKVLKMVANKYLDETISATEASIKALEANCDQVVWELATRIYSQSGHKIELYILRDLINSRIEVVKSPLAAEKERIAEEARRITEEKAAEEASLSDEIISIMEELKIEATQAKIFVKVRKIVSEQLEVDESEVTLDSHISNDLRAGGLDANELAAALEEEFDIEIPNELLGATYTKPPSYFSISIDDSHIVAVACTIRELLLFINNKVSL